MFVVLDEEAEQGLAQLVKAGPAAGALLVPGLTAPLNLEEELIVVSPAHKSLSYSPRYSGVAIPCYASRSKENENPSYPVGLERSATQQLLLLEIEGQDQLSLRAFYFAAASATPETCESEVIRLETDVFSRLKGIFDTRVLAPKTVAVVGVGSGGSMGAVELAKAGVGNFILVDFDRLKPHNISRHQCGIADIGRFKTRAVRDAILQHSPQASVECHEADITKDGALLDEIVERSDLVFVATDNELSKYLINEACVAADTVAVYGGAYERAFAGEVIRVIPGVAGCYACVRQGLASTMRSISSQQVFDYSEDSEFEAEPGLGLDVRFIAMIHAKMALMTLLRDVPSTVGDIDAEMIIWINTARPQDGELFQRPLTRHLVRVPRSQDCPCCGEHGDGQADEEVGAP